MTSMSLYKLVVFTGPKGSGKSSLIKALFPELSVRFDEPAYYRDYLASGGLAVREVASRAEALELVLTALARWRISVGVLVVDASKPIEGAVDPRFLMIIDRAERRCVVASKVDASETYVSEVRKLAQERGLELFAASPKTGAGIEDLKSWIITGQRREVPEAALAQARVAPPPLLVDLIPVPVRVTHMYQKAPDRSMLTDEEREVLELCDGVRGIWEIAAMTGRSYGEVKKIVDSLVVKGFIATFKTKMA